MNREASTLKEALIAETLGDLSLVIERADEIAKKIESLSGAVDTTIEHSTDKLNHEFDNNIDMFINKANEVLAEFINKSEDIKIELKKLPEKVNIEASYTVDVWKSLKIPIIIGSTLTGVIIGTLITYIVLKL